ncbi:unnamed protein product, partial [Phaeothamnion confervicola]
MAEPPRRSSTREKRKVEVFSPTKAIPPEEERGGKKPKKDPAPAEPSRRYHRIGEVSSASKRARVKTMHDPLGSLEFAPTIDFDFGEPLPPPSRFFSSQAAKEAARGDVNVARLLGLFMVTVDVMGDPGKVDHLRAANPVAPPKKGRGAKNEPPRPAVWHPTTGEFSTEDGDHVPVTRLLEWIETKAAKLRRPCAGLEVLESFMALQAPEVSPWKFPLLRLLSVSRKVGKNGLEIVYYVYASRLLFELVADAAIKTIMENLQPVGAVTEPVALAPQPTMFLSAPPGAAADGGGGGAAAAGGVAAVEVDTPPSPGVAAAAAAGGVAAVEVDT